MNIKIFTAGGTIDKVYSDQKGTLNFSFGTPAIKEILEEKIKCNFHFNIEQILAKDSLELTNEDRMLIYDKCDKADEVKILITHGSDSMIETAKVLSGIKNKIIILTGASQSYPFRSSDAEFNVGVAIGALNILESGVYIAMNARVYPWEKCEKQSDGRFVEIN